MTVQPIEWWQLALCAVFIAIAGVSSVALRLQLERDLLWGTFRTVVQLTLVGYVLLYVFSFENLAPVLALYFFMVLNAAYNIHRRVKERSVRFLAPTFVSMVTSYFIITILVTGAIVQVKPWHKPQYFIPLGGMIIGNSMNAITIALDRLFGDLRKQRAQVELLLSLGASYQEATRSILRDAIRAGMLPSINALMTVGIVSLPGMMTGQILAGSPPGVATRYQIVVMLMIVGGTAIGSALTVWLVRKRCFTAAQQLRL
jgi:putative ABC transport system permease protein